LQISNSTAFCRFRNRPKLLSICKLRSFHLSTIFNVPFMVLQWSSGVSIVGRQSA
jgi:hypothetical protein